MYKTNIFQGTERKSQMEIKVVFCCNAHAVDDATDVIVSYGDVSDFRHSQGLVGEFFAVQIQNAGVFLSPPA